MSKSKPKINISLNVEKLKKSFDLSGFDCERESLNEWLKKYAWQSQASNTANTFAVINDNRVAAYYSLCAGSIKVEEVVARISEGQPQNRPIPIIKIARLAVDKDMKGQGLGKAILKDALLRCINAADEIAARAVVIDALDETVRSFYERFDFESGPSDQNTMMLLMKDLKKSYLES